MEKFAATIYYNSKLPTLERRASQKLGKSKRENKVQIENEED